MSSPALIPAAEYLRMSTDDQPNSIALQKEAIRRYAREHGFELVATYADPGRSGVEIKHRAGLCKLIQDVVGGNPGFMVILVYDVSRWGRFQDTDESAHYEFLCRSAGVRIHYCAEQFENDDRMPNKIWKALKRTMAAEYSRELSAKVYAVMRLLASQGFRGGSTAGYGLRRMMISSDGRRKQVLKIGERKRLRADRIILVPGPANEKSKPSVRSSASRPGKNGRQDKSPMNSIVERRNSLAIRHGTSVMCDVCSKTRNIRVRMFGEKRTGPSDTTPRVYPVHHGRSNQTHSPR